MSETEVTNERHGAVHEIVMARPKTKNALTEAMYAEMTRLLRALASDPEVRVVLIRGEGGNFTSGNDLRDFLQNPPKGPESTVFQFIQTIAAFPKPIVAAVDGFAVGLGTTMLLHCDLVYAAEDTKFKMPFVSLGVVPEAGSSYLLPRQFGARRAGEALYFGETFGAQAAFDLGLVSAILPAPAVLEHARARAAKLAAQPAEAVRRTKELLTEHQLGELRAHMDREANVFASMLTTDETRGILEGFFTKK